MDDKKNSVLVIISGGIAAVKVLQVIRLLIKQNIEVETVLTRAACHFVTPLSVAALTQKKPHINMFEPDQESNMQHIALARKNNLILIAPASADILAKISVGIADELATTIILAADIPIIAAPAMNHRMWQNENTKHNVKKLQNYGIDFIMPVKGDMACGEFGIGRLPEPDFIAEYVIAKLNRKNNPLKSRHIIVTAGGTREDIDPIRSITNRSSGKQGFEIAKAARNAGARVTLISAPTEIKNPYGVKNVKIHSATQMQKAIDENLPADVIIMNAAVSDFRPKKYQSNKIKKNPNDNYQYSLELVANLDILTNIATSKNRPKIVIGFAADTCNIIENAKKKLHAKNCDWIIANDIGENPEIIGGDYNKIHIISKSKTESFAMMEKNKVAKIIIDKIINQLK